MKLWSMSVIRWSNKFVVNYGLEMIGFIRYLFCMYEEEWEKICIWYNFYKEWSFYVGVVVFEVIEFDIDWIRLGELYFWRIVLFGYI